MRTQQIGINIKNSLCIKSTFNLNKDFAKPYNRKIEMADLLYQNEVALQRPYHYQYTFHIKTDRVLNDKIDDLKSGISE